MTCSFPSWGLSKMTSVQGSAHRGCNQHQRGLKKRIFKRRHRSCRGKDEQQRGVALDMPAGGHTRTYRSSSAQLPDSSFLTGCWPLWPRAMWGAVQTCKGCWGSPLQHAMPAKAQHSDVFAHCCLCHEFIVTVFVDRTCAVTLYQACWQCCRVKPTCNAASAALGVNTCRSNKLTDMCELPQAAHHQKQTQSKASPVFSWHLAQTTPGHLCRQEASTSPLRVFAVAPVLHHSLWP